MSMNHVEAPRRLWCPAKDRVFQTHRVKCWNSAERLGEVFIIMTNELLCASTDVAAAISEGAGC